MTPCESFLCCKSNKNGSSILNSWCGLDFFNTTKYICTLNINNTYINVGKPTNIYYLITKQTINFTPLSNYQV